MDNKWDKRFLEIAKVVSTWSSCYKHSVGCVIVKDNRIIATGYNGAPSGIEPCRDRKYCYKNSLNIEKGTSMCFATHAEQNALIQAAKLGISIDGATMYTTTEPCSVCAKLIINAGIKRVVYIEEYGEQFSRDLFKMSNVLVEKSVFNNEENNIG